MALRLDIRKLFSHNKIQLFEAASPSVKSHTRTHIFACFFELFYLYQMSTIGNV